MSVILIGTDEEAFRGVMGRSASHCSIQGAKMLTCRILDSDGPDVLGLVILVDQ